MNDGFKCNWCNGFFKGAGANRALAHVSGNKLFGKSGIRFCTGKIPDENKLAYNKLAKGKERHRNYKNNQNEKFNERIQSQNEMLGEELCNEKKRKFYENNMDSVSDLSSNTKSDKKMSSSTAFNAQISRIKQMTSCGKNSLQNNENTNAIEPSNSIVSYTTQSRVFSTAHEQMNMYVADFIFSKALPFSIVEDPKFKLLIDNALTAPRNYQLPNRKLISNTYLDLLYSNYEKEKMEKLKKSDVYFGLSILGDGATIHRKPLFNILVSGVFCPSFVAKVYDCTDDLEVGQNKNAEFICRILRDVAVKVDPGKTLLDLVLVDGASNCQKGGELLSLVYPRVTVMHGCEHILSLFCSDLLKKTKVQLLVVVYRIIYRVFGSGSTHMAYAVFKKHAREYNRNRDIGLIRASGTRMGGYFYAFHRLLRLYHPLLNTINSDEWKNDVSLSKKNLKTLVENIIRYPNFFEKIKIIVLILFPVIKTLRLSDSNKPGMDKIYFFVKQTTKYINTMSKKFNSLFDDSFYSEYSNYKDDDVQKLEDYDLDDSDDKDMDYNMADDPKALSNLWANRANLLTTPWTVSGYLLSIDATIFNDAKKALKDDENCLRQVATKLFSHYVSNVHENKVNKCMQQYHLFCNKLDYFDNPSWYDNDYYRDGDSHLWHFEYTSRHYQELSFVACRVTSKILGIGSCERQWGDVKHTESSKRTSLDTSRLEKQSVLYGAHCLELARMKTNPDDEKHWGIDDLNNEEINKELNSYADGIEYISTQKKVYNDKTDDTNINIFDPNMVMEKVFKAYLEDDERKLCHTCTDVAQYTLLAKYADMRVLSPENKMPYVSTICNDQLVWHDKQSPKEAWGWCCILIPKGITFNIEKRDEYEHVPILGHSKKEADNLHTLIAICNQPDNVTCVDKNGKPINSLDHFELLFNKLDYPGTFEEMPDEVELNPSLKG